MFDTKNKLKKASHLLEESDCAFVYVRWFRESKCRILCKELPYLVDRIQALSVPENKKHKQINKIKFFFFF